MLQVCFVVQPVHVAHIRSRKQVSVDVNRHLNGAVSHLVLDLGERRATLDEQTAEGVAQIMEANPS